MFYRARLGTSTPSKWRAIKQSYSNTSLYDWKCWYFGWKYRISKFDAKSRDIKTDVKVIVKNHIGKISGIAKVTSRAMPGVTLTYQIACKDYQDSPIGVNFRRVYEYEGIVWMRKELSSQMMFLLTIHQLAVITASIQPV
ncbi:hypothetical protein F1B92_00830 [Campylobacter sp. FMV-PI01]|uniref:Molybdopterin dinucleotide-binding domain-containing protein n=1 Tax=Campylobacter portucalensis TaxID=2608384 RepID=A0A6L5WJ50_9BACT|nr:hypothetical protein [Campylobacter portucalensis]